MPGGFHAILLGKLQGQTDGNLSEIAANGEHMAPRRCACHIMLRQRSSIHPNLCSRES
jgi:hypothetical protein